MFTVHEDVLTELTFDCLHLVTCHSLMLTAGCNIVLSYIILTVTCYCLVLLAGCNMLLSDVKNRLFTFDFLHCDGDCNLLTVCNFNSQKKINNVTMLFSYFLI